VSKTSNHCFRIALLQPVKIMELTGKLPMFSRYSLFPSDFFDFYATDRENTDVFALLIICS